MKIKNQYTNEIIGEFDIGPCAYLYGANLNGANLLGAKGMKERQICPKGKSFRAWKKLVNPLGGHIICELEIPRGAKKANHVGSTKCRSNIAKVISMMTLDGKKVSEGRSIYNYNFVYKIGETLRVSDFCDDIRIECAPGVHFFLTKEEARKY